MTPRSSKPWADWTRNAFLITSLGAFVAILQPSCDDGCQYGEEGNGSSGLCYQFCSSDDDCDEGLICATNLAGGDPGACTQRCASAADCDGCIDCGCWCPDDPDSGVCEFSGNLVDYGTIPITLCRGDVGAADETVDGFAGRPGASSCRTLCDCTTLYNMLYVTEEDLGRHEGCIEDCLTSLESTPDCFDVRTRYHFCVLRTSSCVDAEEPEHPGHGAFSPTAEEACPDEAAETAACLEQTGS